MRTGLRRCTFPELRPARAVEAGSRDSSKLPPWLKDAQNSAVVARLRRNFETGGDEPYLGNNAGQVPSLVQGTSEGPEAGSTARRRAYRTKATAKTVDSLPEIDAEDINDPAVSERDIAIRVEQAKNEADRLRMELSEVKEQFDNAEMATAQLVDELLSSRRELNAAREVEQQLSMQIAALVNDLQDSAIAVQNAAKRAEADLATLHSELEAMKSELDGKTSELNELRPQLDLARMQLRIFQETYASSSSQVKTAKMHADQTGEELAVVKAEFGAVNNVDIKNSIELVLTDPGPLLAELTNEHSQADQILKLEAELESAQNAQAVLQDAWWMMREPSLNILYVETQKRVLEVRTRGSKLPTAPSRKQAPQNGYSTCKEPGGSYHRQ